MLPRKTKSTNLENLITFRLEIQTFIVMKRLLLLSLPLLLVFSGCGKLKEKKISIHLVNQFTVNVTEDDDLSMYYTQTINTADDPEGKKYLEHVKSYDIVRITLKVWEYDGPSGAMVTGSFCVGKNPGGDVCHSIENENLLALSTGPDRITLNYTQAQMDKLEAILMDNHKLVGTLEGFVTEKPMTYVVQTVADIDVVVQTKD
jgi:hypothetical protein